MNHPQSITPEFFRRRESAATLGVSESQVINYERAGLIRPIRFPGIRAVRHVRAEVLELAANIHDPAKVVELTARMKKSE